MNNLPEARTAELLEQEAGAELLIYDLRLNKMYHLNETSKIIFSACAQKMTFAELRARYQYSDELIHFALGELRVNNLIEGKTSVHFSELSRRAAIKRAGFTSLAALPLIVAVIAPVAANAASPCPSPTSSNIPANCPVGIELTTGINRCADYSDADKSQSCNSFYGLRCRSGSARYAQGSCRQTALNIAYSCVCN